MENDAAQADPAGGATSAGSAESAARDTGASGPVDSFTAWTEAIGFASDALLSLLAVIAGAFVLYLAIRNVRTINDKIASIQKIAFAGVDIELARQSLSDAARLADRVGVVTKTNAGDVPIAVTAEDRALLLARISLVASVVRHRRILWVDDHPEQNDAERHLLDALGAQVFFATTNAAARSRLQAAPCDLIISDIARDNGDPEDGTQLAAEIATPPVILYVTELDTRKPVPLGAFAITNRPDDLVHYALDVFERKIGEVEDAAGRSSGTRSR